MSVLVLEAITPWVMELARQLSAHVPVTALQHATFHQAKNLNLANQETIGDLHIRTRRFPPGFAGTLSPVFAPLVAAGIKREYAALAKRSGALPKILAPYPYTAPWLRGIPGEQIVYYNLDDYAHYENINVPRFAAWEDELLQRAGQVMCLSIHQTQQFRARYPGRADSITRVPLGIVDTYINPAPEKPPVANTVGYVGNLTDRVDWSFVDKVAELAPDLTFEFVGKAGDEDAGWAAMRAKVFARDNVRFLGPVAQGDVPPYYWRSAVNWMPYDSAHPFNIAASPTKIFDAFGSGRPFVSTAIPEVACYEDRILIARTPAQAADMLHRAAACHDPQKACEMRDFARGHVWQVRAGEVLAVLGRAPVTK